MARKRLSLPSGLEPETDPAGAFQPSAARAPEVKGFGLSAGAPISRVTADTAAAAALELLADEMAQARSGGRMIETIALDAIESGHLVRDRLALDDEEMRSLVESLRLHGQRVPVDLIDLGGGRYGLISGWRRLTALRRLWQETGEARFGTVLALLRRPEGAGAAYVAMVEENEIRAGLSYYERARIAAAATEAGAFPDRGEALRQLYAAASRAKRSKIGSFLTLVDAFDGVLRFPTAIPERLGLALAAGLAVPGFAEQVGADLSARPAGSAEEEIQRLTALLRQKDPRETRAKAPGPVLREIGPGLYLSHPKTGGVLLSGPGADADLARRLEVWLRKDACFARETSPKGMSDDGTS